MKKNELLEQEKKALLSHKAALEEKVELLSKFKAQVTIIKYLLSLLFLMQIFTGLR